MIGAFRMAHDGALPVAGFEYGLLLSLSRNPNLILAIGPRLDPA